MNIHFFKQEEQLAVPSLPITTVPSETGGHQIASFLSPNLPPAPEPTTPLCLLPTHPFINSSSNSMLISL